MANTTPKLSIAQRRFLEMWQRHGPKSIAPPIPEYRFARAAFGRQWRADLCFVPERVIVEFDGGVWSRRGGKKCPVCGQTPQGRHNTGRGYLGDMQKCNAAEALGYVVLKYPPGKFAGREAGSILSEVTNVVLARKRQIEAIAAAGIPLELDQAWSWGQKDRWVKHKPVRRRK